MNKTINVNVVEDKELINDKGKKFYITEIQQGIIFILDENDNLVYQYYGDINEDDDNLNIINDIN